MNSNFVQNTPKVLEAKQKAINKGVPFGKNYHPPYYIEEMKVTLRQINVDFVFEDEYKWFTEENKPKVIYLIKTNLYGVFCRFISKEKAINCCESLNIRHYNIAAKSKNPKKPVLI